MLEHVRSKNKTIGHLMDRLNPLVARLGLDNINRNTVEYLRKSGFRIEQERNIAFDLAKAIVASKWLSKLEPASLDTAGFSALDTAKAHDEWLLASSRVSW